MESSAKEEILLLRASTLPEEFRWSGTDQEIEEWERALANDDEEEAGRPCAAYTFALMLNKNVWLNVRYSMDAKDPALSLHGPDVDRRRLQDLKSSMERLQEEARRQDIPHIVFDVFTGLKIEAEQEDGISQSVEAIETSAKVQSTALSQGASFDMLRVIFWTHHLKAPSKKRDINRWCSDLQVFGLVKSGYPGFMCFEGERASVEEIVRRIKSLQWHAITVKSEVGYTVDVAHADGHADDKEARTNAALLQCRLADQKKGDPARGAGKVRTSMVEMAESSAYVKRLREAGLPEDEILYALNLRS